MPMRNNDLIVGAVGVLQFEVVAFRLKDEYSVDCQYEPVNVYTARWVEGEPAKIEEFKKKAYDNIAIDGGGHLTYLAPTRVNLALTEERCGSFQRGNIRVSAGEPTRTYSRRVAVAYQSPCAHADSEVLRERHHSHTNGMNDTTVIARISSVKFSRTVGKLPK